MCRALDTLSEALYVFVALSSGFYILAPLSKIGLRSCAVVFVEFLGNILVRYRALVCTKKTSMPPQG